MMEAAWQVVAAGFGFGMFVGFMVFFVNWGITAAIKILRSA